MSDEPANPADAEADRLIARALRSVLDSVPELPGGELITAESSPKSQPWAETAAPPGRNKRPLEELVAELQERVDAAPDAVARLPGDVHPADAFLARFSPPTRQGHGRGRRRRGRRAQPQPAQQQTAPPPEPEARSGRRRRGRRRGRGGRGPAA